VYSIKFCLYCVCIEDVRECINRLSERTEVLQLDLATIGCFILCTGRHKYAALCVCVLATLRKFNYSLCKVALNLHSVARLDMFLKV
jgi:hypothetical protein